MFNDEGIVNHFLNMVGFGSVRWFAEPLAALVMLILLSVWQFGSSMLIFLAGLKNIPSELYEAANVDGAGPARRFFRITLPMLSPIILFNAIMQTIGAFMTFVPAYIISKGKAVRWTARCFIHFICSGRRLFSSIWATPPHSPG